MSDTKVFVPFVKRDNDQRIVAGYASTDTVDSQGEVVTIDALKKALPDYMKFGNIREMHQWSAVGKAQEAKVDKKGLFITAKIVDPIAWSKIKEGVYNGFSIGGRILSRVGNKIQEMLMKEISVVDRPANPDTVYTLVKFDDKGRVVVNKIEDPNWTEGYFETMRKVF